MLNSAMNWNLLIEYIDMVSLKNHFFEVNEFTLIIIICADIYIDLFKYNIIISSI